MNDAKTALLVDDNDELRMATGEVLEELGYAVTAANRAEAALRLAASSSQGFDLLVSDVYMPGMNGIELTDRLLARQPDLAVLLISSRGGEPEVRRRLVSGDVAFLPKPFSPEELAAKVDESFGRAAERPGRAPLHAAPVPVIERRPAARTPRPWLPKGAALAAGAVVLVLGLGALIRSIELGAPRLPAPGPEGVTRSATIEAVRPLGPVATAPAELVWLPVDGAATYVLSLGAIDGTVLWRAEVKGPPADVPAEVESSLLGAVTYYWSVEARGTDGSLLARSELAPFAIELAGEVVAETSEPMNGGPHPEDRDHE